MAGFRESAGLKNWHVSSHIFSVVDDLLRKDWLLNSFVYLVAFSRRNFERPSSRGLFTLHPPFMVFSVTCVIVSLYSILRLWGWHLVWRMGTTRSEDIIVWGVLLSCSQAIKWPIQIKYIFNCAYLVVPFRLLWKVGVSHFHVFWGYGVDTYRRLLAA